MFCFRENFFCFDKLGSKFPVIFCAEFVELEAYDGDGWGEEGGYNCVVAVIYGA